MQIRKKIFQNIEKNEWTGVVNRACTHMSPFGCLFPEMQK